MEGSSKIKYLLAVLSIVMCNFIQQVDNQQQPANTGTQPGLMIVQTPGQTQNGFTGFSGTQPNQGTITTPSSQIGTFSSFVAQPPTLTLAPPVESIASTTTTTTTPPSGTVPSSQCYTALTGLVTSYFYAGLYNFQIAAYFQTTGVTLVGVSVRFDNDGRFYFEYGKTILQLECDVNLTPAKFSIAPIPKNTWKTISEAFLDSYNILIQINSQLEAAITTCKNTRITDTLEDLLTLNRASSLELLRDYNTVVRIEKDPLAVFKYDYLLISKFTGTNQACTPSSTSVVLPQPVSDTRQIRIDESNFVYASCSYGASLRTGYGSCVSGPGGSCGSCGC